MEQSRFFVGNLPKNTKEKDLKNIFQEYGNVLRVELKTKENLVDEEDVKIIAFVTLEISSSDAQYCLNDLNWQKVNGVKIRVSLAKESFLDRLKREREEVQSEDTVGKNDLTESSLLTKNSENTRKVFSVDEDLNEDDIAPELLITKKRAANSLYNGKIHIQSYDSVPIHVIEAKKVDKRPLDKKSQNAQQKRKDALNKMKNQYQEKKSAIQQALAGLDVPLAKKIKFSESDEETETIPNNSLRSKTNIFGSDDDGDDDIEYDKLNLKPEHFGKKGEKLLQMQTKQSLDPRFKIDAKFVDGDDEDEVEDHEEDGIEIKQADVEYETANERDWQMGILEQVVGTKIDSSNASQKAAKNKKMLRYDPSNEEHKKYLREAKPIAETVSKPKKKHEIDKAEQVDDNTAKPISTPIVSKEVFYVVTDTLTESLKTRGDGFSLLNMFGKTEEQLERREDKLQKYANEKILVNKLDKSNNLNPFTYDSSSDSDNEKDVNENNTQKQQNETNKSKKNKIFTETFFIPKNDIRLKEGAKFFRYSKKDANEENYEDVRNRLKVIIKTKITKTKKNLKIFSGAGGGHKRRRGKHMH